jgi:hypothetical protein
MKVLTWHGKYDLRCESVPDPEIKAMMDGDGDIVSGWQNKLRGDLEHHACGIGRRAASQDGRARGSGLKK